MEAGERVRISGLAVTWAGAVGVSLEALAEAAGVPLEHLESGADLDYATALRLWSGLEELTGDPHVGLHAGERFRLDQMAVVGPAFAHAETLGVAVGVLARLLPLLMRNLPVDHVDEPDVGGVRYRTPGRVSRHGADAIFAAALTVLRQSTGVAVAPARVELEASAPADTTEHERVFGVRPRWGSSANGLLFRRDDLGLRLRGAAPEVTELLVEHAPSLLTRRRGATALEVEVESAFWAAHHDGGATVASAAAEMGVSSRTLQRRLAAEGRTFAEVRETMLQRRALVLLEDEGWTVERVAGALGYASRSSFERAFTRWFGRSPASVCKGSGRRSPDRDG